jgi:hypothetical protein
MIQNNWVWSGCILLKLCKGNRNWDETRLFVPFSFSRYKKWPKNVGACVPCAPWIRLCLPLERVECLRKLQDTNSCCMENAWLSWLEWQYMHTPDPGTNRFMNCLIYGGNNSLYIQYICLCHMQLKRNFMPSWGFNMYKYMMRGLITFGH